MEITRTAKPIKKTADLTVWHCSGCGVVHMSVGEMVVSFDRDEFAKFVETAVDIHYTGWSGQADGGSIIDLSAANSETLH